MKQNTYKMIVLDLDGTLTNNKKEMSEKAREALLEVMRRGTTVVLASGRSPHGIEHIAEALRLEEFGGYIIAFNGGCIMDCKKGERVYEKFIDQELYSDIFALHKEFNTGLLTYSDNQSYLITEDASNPYAKLDADINRMDLVEPEDIYNYIEYPVPKFLFLGEGKMLGEVEKEVYARIGKKLEVYRSEEFFLEIMPKGIDKGSALKKLCGMKGIDIKYTIAFGDGYNDLSMIRSAGFGIAMGNAVEEVKKAADYITASNEDEGVVKALYKFFL